MADSMMTLTEDNCALICAKAAAARKRWSKGIRVVSLHDLGISPLSRAVSYKYVHYLLWLILRKQGFTRDRYHVVTIVEANPADLLEVFRHVTEVVAASGGHLAPPTKSTLMGVLAKNHLVCGLQALLNGTLVWDGDGSPLKPPPKGDKVHAELWETLERADGFSYVRTYVLDYMCM